VKTIYFGWNNEIRVPPISVVKNEFSTLRTLEMVCDEYVFVFLTIGEILRPDHFTAEAFRAGNNHCISKRNLVIPLNIDSAQYIFGIRCMDVPEAEIANDLCGVFYGHWMGYFSGNGNIELLQYLYSHTAISCFPHSSNQISHNLMFIASQSIMRIVEASIFLQMPAF
jgi:hypothetical protein